MFDVSHADGAGTRKLLNIMLVLSIIDVVLLVPLVLGLFGIIDSDSFKQPVGMIHGLAFVVLVLIALLGVRQSRWNTKFILWTFISGIVGLVVIVEVMIRREFDAGVARASLDPVVSVEG